MSGNGNYYNRRWLRPTEAQRLRGRRSVYLFHIGEPSPRYYEAPVIWAYCGIGISGDASSPEPFEVCQRDCDESQHCRQCTKSLNRRIEGRRA